jgi:class 3 adenylate cyclase
MFLDPNLGRAGLPCAQALVPATGGARTTVPGIIVHAQAVNDLLRGEILRKADDATLALFLVVLAALGAVAARLDVRPGAAAVLGIGVIWTAGANLAAEADLVLPWIGGLVATGCGYVVMLAYTNLVIDRERKRSVLALSRYLDPSVARALLAGPKPPELGGETREITVWFSDIANFSTIAETLLPQDLVARLNAHFSMVAAEIEAEGGIIDKFVGDAVVAIFGAPLQQPDHAARAIRAARKVAAATRDPTQSPGGFAMRIGLNTGEALVGNIGTRRRFDYTVIGDTANVAQRIEQANKDFGTTVLVSAATARAAGAALDIIALGSARVKGRDGTVEVWTLAEDAARHVRPAEG